MVRAERLSGQVEVDETVLGGVEHGGKRGRGSRQNIVVIAVEVKEPKGFGRVRMRHVPDASAAGLRPFVCDVGAPGALVGTDGWGADNVLPEHGDRHRQTVLANSGAPAHVARPGGPRIASLLKRWIRGTHQGSAPLSICSPTWRRSRPGLIAAVRAVADWPSVVCSSRRLLPPPALRPMSRTAFRGDNTASGRKWR